MDAYSPQYGDQIGLRIYRQYNDMHMFGHKDKSGQQNTMIKASLVDTLGEVASPRIIGQKRHLMIA